MAPEPVATETVKTPHLRPVPARIVLERTGCMGLCPSYTVTILGNGTIEWIGEANVAAIGTRAGAATRTQLEQLSRMIDKARFFDLDESGHIPVKPACVRTGNTVSCSISSFSMCTDTSHAIITITRGQRTHQIDDAHCFDQPTALVELEDFIDEVAKTDAWVGR
ncbi:MAG: hypothetical protein JWO36_6978 [Myxococcales bacterium]|nr:hypothetical protein [Myxococcales bacterium]